MKWKHFFTEMELKVNLNWVNLKLGFSGLGFWPFEAGSKILKFGSFWWVFSSGQLVEVEFFVNVYEPK